MRRSTLVRQRLLAVFIAGVFFIISPMIFLFDRPGLLFGMPPLYVYFFSIWGLLIAAMAWVVGGRRE